MAVIGTYVGLDVGGTNARGALIRLTEAQPEVVSEARRPIPSRRDPVSVADTLCALVADVASGEDFDGLGVGLAAQLDRSGRVVLNAPNLGWRNEPFADRLEAALGVQVGLFNDLSAIAWGEASCGAVADFEDVLAVYVGTGIGSGVIVGGQLYVGAGGNAGELGHAKLPGIEARCGCGQVGCIEALAGGRAIDDRVRRDLESGEAQSLALFLGPDAPPPHPGDVDRAYRAGDPYAARLWREVANGLADVLSGALAVLDPQALLLGGGVIDGCPGLRALLLARLQERTAAVIWADVEVVRPTLGSEAGMLGAAFLLHALRGR